MSENKMPEKIWVQFGERVTELITMLKFTTDKSFEGGHEYILTSTVTTTLAEKDAEIDALDEKCSKLGNNLQRKADECASLYAKLEAAEKVVKMLRIMHDFLNPRSSYNRTGCELYDIGEILAEWERVSGGEK